ncbi:hypothetical protein GWA97_01580 [Flavobacterium sp. LaA7.5]|nr:hypothetical protein [Flavobacterium salilacus subsp. altitudinum]
MEFKLLEKFIHGKFIYNGDQELSVICNAPRDKSGVYLVYSIKSNQKNLIYVGCSGHIKTDGVIAIRKTGLGGLKGRIVNGHQFGKKRNKSWREQMIKENIDALEIYWYVTHTDSEIESPGFIEFMLLNEYYKSQKKLPEWNKKF